MKVELWQLIYKIIIIREAVDTVYEVLCNGQDIVQPESDSSHTHEHSHSHFH